MRTHPTEGQEMSQSEMAEWSQVISAHHPYPHAPIAEAVIDIRVTLPESVDLDALAKVGDAESSAYPIARKRMEYQSEMSFADEQVTTTDSTQQVGHVFVSTDEKQVFQSRLDGFSFSRLAPYESWEPVETEAFRLWRVYRDVTKPEAITRVAVRYINRIPLPSSDPFELDQYLRTFPEISSDLPQLVESYLMQVQIPLPEYSATLMMIQTTLVQPDGYFLVLDNDVAKLVDEPYSKGTDDKILHWLRELRHAKNEVFEASITNKTRRLFY